MTPILGAASLEPQSQPATRLQEQFTGPLPQRSERPMSEILAERLATADPSRPAPVFVP